MKNHCCPDLESSLTFDCKTHADKYSCPDALIDYSERFDEYGLIIHDGGSGSVAIEYCPFCGTKLPESKRGLWFDTLESMGFDDPFEQKIPHKFNTSAWYKNT